MRISILLEEFKNKHVIGRGLKVAEREIEEIIQKARSEETTITSSIEKLDEIHQSHVTYNDINGKILNSKMFGVE